MDIYTIYNSLLDSARDSFFQADPRLVPSKVCSEIVSNNYPKINYGIDTNGGFIIRAALAGWKKEDISVEFEDNYLSIEIGKEPVENEDKSKSSETQEEISWIQKGFKDYTWAKQRIFIDSSRFNVEKMTMTFENGLLEISAPKAEAQKLRKITFN